MEKQKIAITLTENKKQKPDASKLEFGRTYTDHMFIMDYSKENGWHNPRIIPYQPIELDPAAKVLHYGQSVFEGMKAYLSKDGEILLFRPEQNMKRINQSSHRLCIPQIDEQFALEALNELLKIDKDWIPTAEGTSLYIRPFIIATEPFLGLASSKTFQFIIICSPVGAYYKEGINPVKIMVEDEYVRAVPGGTGEAKTGGNYAASLLAQVKSAQRGYSQVLWLDGVERKYIEEVGSMNVFFKIDGEIVTPALNGSILPGITRDSIIQVLKHWNLPIVERRITIEEIFTAHENGKLEEVFGTGTAAVISPVGELIWGEKSITINNGQTGELSRKLYETLTSIQTGEIEDPFGWRVVVK